LDEEVNALEEVDENIVNLHNIPHSLIIEHDQNIIHIQICDKEQMEKRTPRRTPTPVKIVFAGENA
jgi:hypothetical protein